MTSPRRYRAFISYSHGDAEAARWLQRALERYRPPAALRASRPDLPARLYPVFRDQDELASAHDLSDSIRQAMDDSEALVVVCSPAAAASRWVNEEIRHFRASGRGHRIFCYLVAGQPDIDSAQCAFPTALLHDEHGKLLHEPLAADATPAGDGRRNAMLRWCIGHPVGRVARTHPPSHEIGDYSQRERHRHPAVKPPHALAPAHCGPPAAWIIFQPLPAGSRKPASMLPKRSTGSCVNSTPRDCNCP